MCNLRAKRARYAVAVQKYLPQIRAKRRFVTAVGLEWMQVETEQP